MQQAAGAKHGAETKSKFCTHSSSEKQSFAQWDVKSRMSLLAMQCVHIHSAVWMLSTLGILQSLTDTRFSNHEQSSKAQGAGD